MITILNIILIAISLSMDSFALAFSYGIEKPDKKTILKVSIFVGLFHFIMPLFGSFVGKSIFEIIYIKPNIILFIVFLLISLDMISNYFEDNKKLRKLNLLGTILFAFSVSFDSFSVGIGLNYIYDNIIISVLCFSIISFIFTLIGFISGKIFSTKTGKYSFLLGGILLLAYSIKILTN